MCGRFNLLDTDEVHALCESLEVEAESLRFSRDISPASPISIVRADESGRYVSDAIWWLKLDHHGRPNPRVTSFNSRAARLHEERYLGYKPYRQSRCIIPASAFVEGLGDRKTYHKIELTDQAIAFGGLCQDYINVDTGEVITGASIITLGPLAQWRDIHPQSMPLMLPWHNSALVQDWLDPACANVVPFEPLLKPVVTVTQRVVRIDKPSQWNEVDAPFYIVP